MSKIFISYGDGNFSKSLRRIGREAKALGKFDRVILYTPKDLPNSITASPLFCFGQKGGYWLWKPYLINKTLALCKEGDIIYYVDAGCTLNADSAEWEYFGEVMKEKNGIFFQYRDIQYEGWEQFCTKLENNNPKILHWMKPSAIEYFKDYIQSSAFMEYNKIMGGFIIIKKCKFMRIIDEWFDTMLFYPQLVFEPFGNDLNNLPETFNVHRHDQSILTPLVFYYKDKDNLCVLPETSESEKESAAVVASRKRDRIKRPFWIRLKNKINRIRRGE